MNRLSKETSPYLLQHAHNPVDWYAWKPEAFERAREENKPILVSIGYSTCHWCHVMERESFENETVAAFMNKHFINIKVDREERPDVDQIYMEACQVISGSGGWPLNCFLTPDGRPFYAATYFPPEPRHNRPSWIQVLNNISQAFQTKRDTVENQANRLMEIINNSDSRLLDLEVGTTSGATAFDKGYLEEVYYKIRERFDRLEGGFGGAPKFPGTMSLRFLLQYHYQVNNEEALEHTLFSLDKMIMGGIYDQLGGGFARYTVDRAWLVPHFEKMLYDNALLIELLSDAYKLTGKELYRETIEETLRYVERELMSPEGGFYSAQDADSEGVEGKFYVWTKEEVDNILGADSTVFCAFYDITEEGNWEEKNILRRLNSFDTYAKDQNIEPEALKTTLAKGREELFKKRDQRIYPGLDDKILLDWNALMCSAFANAYSATGEERYKVVAQQNLDFLFQKLKKDSGPGMYHTYKAGLAQYDAFLNDYAYFIKAVLDVYSISFDFALLEKVQELIDFVQDNFFDEANDLYFFTVKGQQDIITRKKEIYDSATPSGNAVMVENLLRAGTLLNAVTYTDIAQKMLIKMKGAIATYPGSFAQWAQSILLLTSPVPEIAILGENAEILAKQIRAKYIPGAILMASDQEREDYELLKNRFTENQTLIYLCRNYTCQRPVKSVKELVDML